MTKKDIILTFDYELFLGSNLASAQEVLVEPTTSLLAKLQEADIKATFFIDLTYLLCMQDIVRTGRISDDKNVFQTLKSEYECVLENIDQIIQQGHELGIHFHPQWKDAVYRDGKWSFASFKHYALHNLTGSELNELFSSGVSKFRELYERTGTSCPSTLCFRAGGWCIHPFDRLRDLFLQHGIVIDSSVTVPFFRTPYFYPGEIPVPEKRLRRRGFWRFSSDPLLEDTKGEFLEIPIDTCFSTLLDLWRAAKGAQKLEWKKNGTFVPGPTGFQKKLLRLKKALHFGEHTMLTLDVENPAARYTQFQRFFRKTDGAKGFVFLSHPKQFGAQSIKMLDKLVASDQFNFLRLTDYAMASRKQ